MKSIVDIRRQQFWTKTWFNHIINGFFYLLYQPTPEFNLYIKEITQRWPSNPFQASEWRRTKYEEILSTWKSGINVRSPPRAFKNPEKFSAALNSGATKRKRDHLSDTEWESEGEWNPILEARRQSTPHAFPTRPTVIHTPRTQHLQKSHRAD
jgi:hypothetical protein